MPRATRVRCKTPAAGKKKTRRLRKQHLRTRRTKQSAKRKQTRRLGGGTQMGKDLLRLFNPEDGLSVLARHMAGRLSDEDIINIVRCHPLLWKHRKEILHDLLKISVSSFSRVLKAPPKYREALCLHLSKHELKHVGMVLFRRAATSGDLERLKNIYRDFGLTPEDAQADGFLTLHMAATKGHIDIVRHLTDEIGLAPRDAHTAYTWRLIIGAARKHPEVTQHLQDILDASQH